jgi:hypothetical protein
MTGQLIRLDRVRKEFGRQVRGFDRVGALQSRQRMDGSVLCGRPCSRAIHPATELARFLERAANPGVARVVLPTTNLHLRDMQPGRSRPGWDAALHSARSSRRVIRSGFYHSLGKVSA